MKEMLKEREKEKKLCLICKTKFQMKIRKSKISLNFNFRIFLPLFFHVCVYACVRVCVFNSSIQATNNYKTYVTISIINIVVRLFYNGKSCDCVCVCVLKNLMRFFLLLYYVLTLFSNTRKSHKKYVYVCVYVTLAAKYELCRLI